MADNILGTTTDAGLGANRKARNPRFYSSTAKLNTGGAMQGVGLGVGRVALGAAGSINAPKFTSRNIAPFIQETPEAKGPLISQKAVSEGMNALATSVENYVDDVEEIRAKESLIVLNEKLTSLYYGRDGEEGFRSTEGLGAVDGYKKYSADVDSMIKDTLEGLNPYARQKALMGAFAKRDQFLNVASEHVVGQKNSLDLASRQNERESILRDVITDPRNALGGFVKGADGKEEYRPSALKAQYLSTFKPHQQPQAKNGWDGLILDAADRIYLDGRPKLNKDGSYSRGSGLTDVQAFRQTVGAIELGKDNLLKLDKKIFSWNIEESKQYLNNMRLREATDNKLTKRQQTTEYANLMLAYYDEDKPNPTVSHAATLLAAGKIDDTQFRSYKATANSAAKGPEKVETDVSEYNRLNRLATQLSSSNSIVSESMSLAQEVTESPFLSDTDSKSIIRTVLSYADKKKASNRNDAILALDLAIADTFGGVGTDAITASILKKGKPTKTDTKDKLEYDALREYDQLVDDGWKHREAIDKVSKKYASKDVQFTYLPYMDGYGKPGSRSEYRSVQKKLDSDLAFGMITEQQYQEAALQMKEYFNYFLSMSKTKIGGAK